MKIVECPRDAMQGIESYIPAESKAAYINLLLKVGFDTIDFGSFVSPKVVPQMKDTEKVLELLDPSVSTTKLLAIVANVRGANTASQFDQIDYLGYPLSISETFQERNTNKTIGESLNILQQIQELCIKKGKTLVTYISMGFGNPYGEPYNEEIVLRFSDVLKTLEIKIISLADTIGVATTEKISSLYKLLSQHYPDIEFGCHLHSNPQSSFEKVIAAYNAGCRRLDGAINGFGGCPMAEDELVGNIATETILSALRSMDDNPEIDNDAFEECMMMASQIFN